MISEVFVEIFYLNERIFVSLYFFFIFSWALILFIFCNFSFKQSLMYRFTIFFNTIPFPSNSQKEKRMFPSPRLSRYNLFQIQRKNHIKNSCNSQSQHCLSITDIKLWKIIVGVYESYITYTHIKRHLRENWKKNYYGLILGYSLGKTKEIKEVDDELYKGDSLCPCFYFSEESTKHHNKANIAQYEQQVQWYNIDKPISLSKHSIFRNDSSSHNHQSHNRNNQPIHNKINQPR